jgi:AcrR family transcriptional regulator
MLTDALAGLLGEKGFNDISVQEIVDRATLNRATFYLHYPDKNALLHAMAESRFRDLIKHHRVALEGEGMLRTLALTVCEYLVEITQCPVKGAQLPLESSMIPVMEGVIQRGLVQRSRTRDADTKLLARTTAWAVFGAATLWFTSPKRISSAKMASNIDRLVRPILANSQEPSPD